MSVRVIQPGWGPYGPISHKERWIFAVVVIVVVVVVNGVIGARTGHP